MNWTMPYPWRSRSDSVRRINMSSEPGNESFFCALRPIPRILSLRRRDYASQVQIVEPSRRKTISGCSRAPDANRYGARCRCKEAIDQLHCSAKTRFRLSTNASRKLSPRRQARRSIAAAKQFTGSKVHQASARIEKGMKTKGTKTCPLVPSRFP